MSSLNISVLAQGREFYLRQLKLHLTPLICEGLISIYEDATVIEQETSEYGGNFLKQFQKQLTLIPTWNQSQLEEETRRILTECNFLMEMVAAVFVAHVQILASVKLGGKNSKIRVKIPTADIFIHAIYTKSAETFYYNPYKFKNYHVRESIEYIREMVNRSTDDVIDGMIPIESIIKEYISNVFNSHTKENPRAIETVEPDAPGVTLDHNDLDLDSFNYGKSGGGRSENESNAFETPINDNFGTGTGGFNNFDEKKLFDFKDDETDIFSTNKDNSPFKDIPTIGSSTDSFTDIFKQNSDTTDTTDLGMKDTKDTHEFGADPDPFKVVDGKDPFETVGGTDPFKNDSGIGSGLDDIPNPPELEKNGIFSQKPAEINFFDDIP